VPTSSLVINLGAPVLCIRIALMRIRLITLMRIRTRLFTLMLIRIRIQILALKKTSSYFFGRRIVWAVGTNRKIVSRTIEEFQHPAIQSKRVQHLSVFFHQIKVRQPIGGKDTPVYKPCATVCRRSRTGGIFVWSGSELELLIQIFKIKIKNQKSTAVGVLIKAYPMIPLSSRSNLSGRNLKTHAETTLILSLYNSFHFIKIVLNVK